MSAALDLRPWIGNEVYVPLKSLQSSARTKTLEGMPLTVQTDGSEKKGTTAIGFVIHDVTSSELVLCGDVDF